MSDDMTALLLRRRRAKIEAYVDAIRRKVPPHGPGANDPAAVAMRSELSAQAEAAKSARLAGREREPSYADEPNPFLLIYEAATFASPRDYPRDLEKRLAEMGGLWGAPVERSDEEQELLLRIEDVKRHPSRDGIEWLFALAVDVGNPVQVAAAGALLDIEASTNEEEPPSDG